MKENRINNIKNDKLEISFNKSDYSDESENEERLKNESINQGKILHISKRFKIAWCKKHKCLNCWK